MFKPMGSLPKEKIKTVFPMFLLASSLDATVLPLLLAFIQTGYKKAQVSAIFHEAVEQMHTCFGLLAHLLCILYTTALQHINQQCLKVV